jgi:septum formation protein
VLILASSSPRRAQTLTQLGLRFRIVKPDVDETLLPDESGVAAAERLAREKAGSVARTESGPVLAADTLVVAQGRVLGKPGSEQGARAMLQLLSGRTHEVVTGLCLVAGGRTISGVDRTAVTFAAMSEDEIHWYAATNEPVDKAGGYHVDGRGGLFITGVAGSPSNVAGLPVRLFLAMVREAGLDLGLPREEAR